MAITSSGIGSNLDVEGIVKQLMTAERQPVTQLETREAKLQAKISAYGSLKSALATLQSKATALSLPTKFNVFSTTVSTPESLKVSAFSTAASGQHSVVIKELAEAQHLASSGFSSVDASVGSGEITIQFGSVSGGVFAADPERSAQSITISSEQGTLAGIRDAIQAANVGVTATVVNDGSTNGYRLVLASAQTGESSIMKITVSGDSDSDNANASGLSSLVYDPATAGTKNMEQTLAANNAVLKVDGIDNIIKKTNSVSDVINGVTLNLQKASLTDTITVTVDRDAATVSKSVKEFVEAYNALQQAVTTATAYDFANKRASVLTGDSAARDIQGQVRAIMSSIVATTPNGYSSLSDVGITLNKGGSLDFNSSKFETALNTYPADVSTLFAGSNGVDGFGARINTLITSLTDEKGKIGSRVDGLTSSIALLTQQKSRLSDRLVLVEARYRKQFGALDSLMGSMLQTSNFLTQQFAALQANSNN